MSESRDAVERPTPTPARTVMPRAVLVLGLASLLNDVASEMVFPLLPVFVVAELGASRSALGLIEGAADMVASLLKLVSGAWSDRGGGRKAYIVVGYALTALLRPLLAGVGAVWQVGAIRAVDRIGKGIRTAPRDALIADSTVESERGRAFGFHRSMDHLGAAVGPLLATAFLWVWPDRLRWLFAAAALPGAALVLLVARGLPRDPANGPEEARRADAGPSPGKRSSAPLFAAPERRLRGFLFALALFTLGNSSDAFLLLRAEELGVERTWLPLLWCGFHILKSLGTWRCGGWADRLGARRMIVVGWGWYAVVYWLFGAATEAWHAVALFGAYAVYYSLAEPAEKKLVAQLAGVERRGAAYGWFNLAIGAAALPASLVFGRLYDLGGARLAFSCGAAIAAFATVALLASLRASPPSERQGETGRSGLTV